MLAVCGTRRFITVATTASINAYSIIHNNIKPSNAEHLPHIQVQTELQDPQTVALFSFVLHVVVIAVSKLSHVTAAATTAH
jgi:hypothetical protein